ncbi:hypothetical protein NP233_g4821 [Leucocoprinus birnbaumii]|uniref:Uncharacterized protein n=1 Tax=Leucocoprinus birnbaumii TaxID=56174 RepID=A0AAD5YX86_9AGAR|nr:hypothetical protein NP233_g4821 [Leucocoprinus birnbaumii]
MIEGNAALMKAAAWIKSITDVNKENRSFDFPSYVTDDPCPVIHAFPASPTSSRKNSPSSESNLTVDADKEEDPNPPTKLSASNAFREHDSQSRRRARAETRKCEDLPKVEATTSIFRPVIVPAYLASSTDDFVLTLEPLFLSHSLFPLVQPYQRSQLNDALLDHYASVVHAPGSQQQTWAWRIPWARYSALSARHAHDRKTRVN